MRRKERQVAIETFLEQCGFEDDLTKAQAWLILEQAGIVQPGTRIMDRRRVGQARQAIAEKLIKICSPECALVASRLGVCAKVAVVVRPNNCDICFGSNNRRAGLMTQACLQGAGISKVLIVGGRENNHQQARELFGHEGLELRFVHGHCHAHLQRDADIDKKWADLVVIWGSMPLDHSLSIQYTSGESLGKGIVATHKPGVVTLCYEIIRNLDPDNPLLRNYLAKAKP